MRKISFFLPLLLLLPTSTNAQHHVTDGFIKDFPLYSDTKVINFEAVFGQKKMQTDWAISIVYDGDSSRLFCKEKIVNLENEREYSISRELYLPELCFRLKIPNGHLVAYTSYECQDVNKPLYRKLHLLSVQGLKETDILVGQVSDEFDNLLTGLLNPATLKIFIVGILDSKKKTKTAQILSVKDGRFIIDKEQADIAISLDGTEKYLQYLGWSSYFNLQ